MLKSKKQLAACICASLMTQPLLAAELQNELLFLRDNNPLIRASDFAVKAADAREQAAESGWYPKVDLSADIGPEKITTTNYNGDAAGDPSTTDLTRKKWSVSVSQNLYSGGRTAATVETAKLSRDIKSTEYTATSQEVLLEAVVAYLQVLRSHILMRLGEINEQTTRNQLDLEQKRVRMGGGVVVDEKQAATRLQVVRERRVVYEQEMRDALATYEQVFGKAPDLDTLEDLETYLAKMPQSLDEAIALAESNNPRLLAAQLTAEKAEASIALERADFGPSVDLVINYNKDRDAAGLYEKEEQTVLLTTTWNWYNGGEDTHLAEAARFDQLEAVEIYKNTQNRTFESVRLAWNQYQKGVERQDLLKEAADTALEVMEGRKRLRDSGKETALAVLDAEVEYFGILASKVNAMIEARIGGYRLLSTLGLLNIQDLGLEGDEMVLPVRPVNTAIDALLSDVN
mgnify:FL=1